MMPCPTCGASDVRGPFEEARELSELRSEIERAKELLGDQADAITRLTEENGRLKGVLEFYAQSQAASL